MIDNIYPLLFGFLVVCGLIQGFNKPKHIEYSSKKHKINDHYIFLIEK